MPKGKKIHITVGEEQRKRWKESAEESTEFRSMAELVRRAVEEYIDTDENQTGGAGSIDSIEEILAEVNNDSNENVVEEIRQLERSVEDVQDSVNAIHRSINEPPEITSFAARVYTSLPAAKPDSTDHKKVYGSMDVPESVVPSGAAEDVGHHLFSGPIDEKQISRIENALNELQEDGLISSIALDDELRYWRSE